MEPSKGGLTALQAEILHIIVQEAKKAAWRVTTSDALASILLYKQVGKLHSPRAAGGHLQRLQEKLRCFYKRGKSRYINHNALCTEPESALFLLVLDDLSINNSEGRVAKKSLYKLLHTKLQFDSQVVEELFVAAKKAGYLEEIHANPEYIRPGYQTKNQRLYLELLAPQYKQFKPAWLDSPVLIDDTVVSVRTAVPVE